MKVILTCTTTANRLNIFYYGIQSLLNQTIIPDLFIVNLAEEEFGSKAIYTIPEWLKNPRIIVQLTRDTGPYKKLLPSLIFADDNDLIITADDDVIYHEGWLETLVKTSKANPDYIICSIAREMKKNIFNKWKNYGAWPHVLEEKTSLDLLPIGAGGVLYKKELLDVHFLCDENFIEVAPGTDDLWFKMASLNMKSKVRVIPFNSFESMSIQHKKGLQDINFKKSRKFSSSIHIDYLYTVFCNNLGKNLTRNDVNWDAILSYKVTLLNK